MSQYKSVFDIIGPVMVGPSSSHTAGAVRIGSFARTILGGTPKRAQIELHGSFAETGPGHGTHKGLVGGLIGMATDEPDLPNAYARAKALGMEFTVSTINLGSTMHPNSARLTLESEKGESIQLIGTSIGGGSVVITEVNGYQVRLSGEYPTLITVHADLPGVIQRVASILTEFEINIAFMNVSRQHRGRDAFMTIEGDHAIPDDALTTISALPEMHVVRYLPKLI